MRVYSRCGCVGRRVAFALFGLMFGFAGSETAVAAGSGAIVGQARVVDGDTIEIGASKIRLEGIDAPETGQACSRRWFGKWNCGAAATSALSKLVRNQTVTCEATGADKYGRTLAICTVGGRDINAYMVRQGLAWAFIKYSRRYVSEEYAARGEHLGVWQAPTTSPWDYRASQWVEAASDAPKGCAIKGNVSRQGNIYHMPWSPWYGKVKMDGAPGKRWFCSEAEAVAAGWRPAREMH